MPDESDTQRAARALLPPVLLLGTLLATWQLVSTHGPWPHYLFPGPLAVVRALADTWDRGDLQVAIWATLRRLVLGFSLSIFIGMALALLMASQPWAHRAVKPLLLGFQSLPGVAWVPVALLWFGFGERALIFVTVVGSIWAVALAFSDGLATVPPLYFRAARNLGARGAVLVTHVGLPAALPVLVSGAKQSWAFAWRSLVGAEIVFASIGLGFLLNQGRDILNVAQVIGIMLVTLAVGMAFEILLFARMDAWVRTRWGLRGRRN